MFSLSAFEIAEKVINKEPITERIEGYKTIILSPNDLIYVPTEKEALDLNTINWKDKKHISSRIYKMVSSTDKKCQFKPHRISNQLIEKDELGSGNKSERAWDGVVEYTKSGSREDTGTMIKNYCIKLKTDRLGNYKPVL